MRPLRSDPSRTRSSRTRSSHTSSSHTRYGNATQTRSATQTRAGVLRCAAAEAAGPAAGALGPAKPPRLTRAAAKRRAPELAALGWALGVAIATLHYGAAWLGYDAAKLDLAGARLALSSALAAPPPASQIQIILAQRASLSVYLDSSPQRPQGAEHPQSAAPAPLARAGARARAGRGQSSAPLRELISCPQAASIKSETRLDPAELSRELAPCLAKVHTQ